MNGQKGLVQRIERTLEAAVGDAFARVFGGSIVPQELEAALRREAADGVRPLHGNRLLVPNEYIISLGGNDYENVGADSEFTSDVFAKHLAGYISGQGWQTYGEVVVRFDRSTSLRTGQFRTRAVVNPDAESRPAAGDFAPAQSDHAFSAEPGVPPMTENSSYRGGPGQGRPGDDYPGDDYYEEGYQRNESPSAQDARGGQEAQGYPPGASGYPSQPGYPPPRYPEQHGYPDQGGYPAQSPGGYPDQGGYPAQSPSGYSAPYEQRPPAGYGPGPGPAQGYDPGYRQGGGYGPGGGQPDYAGGYGDYGRGTYGPPEQQPPYPEPASGYQQGYQDAPGYGRQDYGQSNYPQYSDASGGGVYAPPGAGYAEPHGRDYDYGQPAMPGGYGPAADYGHSGGYGGYGQPGYAPSGHTVTLQLDDGSGRTYQLREGSNIIGRGQDAQFRLPDTGVSRRHLEIRWDGQVALLSDLNSTNGTMVNNAPVQEWQLADGDVIRLGHSEIIVHIQ
ncbi:DUF3662 and FHA domain-containing protein [Mycobacterium sp. SM1]|uniref:DUF3662 and FHA domain-containing protein n=1 Tax=Mycobacterium sp. SM1 TaxID=2816243 RepID=UPI001BCEFFA6|nr:DUF3662 and FHA domain-containing protein [Mycobacterium sp. SM1]MBS4728092.1 DUF3662 and FHA domain-containing protein [Mycobacterium sp. SM1]